MQKHVGMHIHCGWWGNIEGVTEEHDQFSKNPEEIRLEGGLIRGL